MVECEGFVGAFRCCPFKNKKKAHFPVQNKPVGALYSDDREEARKRTAGTFSSAGVDFKVLAQLVVLIRLSSLLFLWVDQRLHSCWPGKDRS